MPSWNIHTAHAERLLAQEPPAALGIEDVNAYLFGNVLPDVYVGYMVPAATMRIDYRFTHMARGDLIPLPDPDRFWEAYVLDRDNHLRGEGAARSLLLGAWAHIAVDRAFNAAFRQFWRTHDVPEGEQLRIRKQADFDLFGRSLAISSHVEAAPELLEAAYFFGPHRVLAEDVRRACKVANHIVDTNVPERAACDHYQLLDEAWMEGVLGGAVALCAAYLRAAARLAAAGDAPTVEAVRAASGLGAQPPDDPHWQTR